MSTSTGISTGISTGTGTTNSTRCTGMTVGGTRCMRWGRCVRMMTVADVLIVGRVDVDVQMWNSDVLTLHMWNYSRARGRSRN
jgi:hypothetical protein